MVFEESMSALNNGPGDANGSSSSRIALASSRINREKNKKANKSQRIELIQGNFSLKRNVNLSFTLTRINTLKRGQFGIKIAFSFVGNFAACQISNFLLLLLTDARLIKMLHVSAFN